MVNLLKFKSYMISDGDPVIECLVTLFINSTLNRSFKHLSVVVCGDPGDTANATRAVDTGYGYLGEVLYQCDLGFELTSGTLHRTCQADGFWNGTDPICSGKLQTILN